MIQAKERGVLIGYRTELVQRGNEFYETGTDSGEENELYNVKKEQEEWTGKGEQARSEYAQRWTSFRAPRQASR